MRHFLHHHAVALALVGWYPMVPFATSSNALLDQQTTDPSLPLSRWTIEKSFDSASECESVLDTWHNASVTPDGSVKMQLNPLKAPPPKQNNERQRNWDVNLSYARCIASDDPRLKEK